jgi:hypothetical protein
MNGRDVIERLEALSDGEVTGDWLDVVRRAERRRAAAVRRRLLVAAAAAVLLVVPAIAVAQRIADALIVDPDPADVDVPWVSGRVLHNFDGKSERRLAGRIWFANTVGYDLASAIPSADRHKLLYLALDRGAAPGSVSLRLLETDTERDTLVGRGIYGAAWRGDGVLAYSSAREALRCCGSEHLELGHVYVRPTPDAPPIRWTRFPSHYEVFAWAGDELLVAARVVDDRTVRRRFGAPQETPGVYALGAPGRLRRLPLAAVSALDPTGRYAIGPTSLYVDFPAQATLRMVRISDGAILDEQPLAPIVRPDAQLAEPAVPSGGSWAGEFIVIGVSGVNFGETSIEGDNALVVLRFDGELDPVHVFRLDTASAETAGLDPRGFGSTLYSPRFADAEGRWIVALGSGGYFGSAGFGSALLLCDRIEQTCRRSEELSPGNGVGFVENPSRPLPD